MNKEKLVFKLSPQAVGAIMMAMQKGIKAAMEERPKEECDITSMLSEFELVDRPDGQGLDVLNAPFIQYDYTKEVEEAK